MDRNEMLGGFDVGGTKCAVVLGELSPDRGLSVLAREGFPTADFPVPEDCLEEMCRRLGRLAEKRGSSLAGIRGIGISCGGPLDSGRGLVQSPPNLPGWDDVPAVRIVSRAAGVPAALQNDANAGALAEWRFGAGRGVRDMVFLTFGTGLGAGIIAGGRLLEGCGGLAGECGHVRLAADGPCGHGKRGSFEGFCSGGGIAGLGRMLAEELLAEGQAPVWCPDEGHLPLVSAAGIAQAARAGDAAALGIFRESGRRLGEGLSVLIDVLNPERIVIGSIFVRAEDLLRPEMERAIRREALPAAARRCRVLPAGLGERLGDVASLAIAAEALDLNPGRAVPAPDDAPLRTGPPQARRKTWT